MNNAKEKETEFMGKDVPLLEFVGNGPGSEGPLETKDEKRRRHISLWVMYLTTFLQSLGGSIVITGMWPYLQKLDGESSKEWFGWVVAANPLGQLISSPLIGWVCNRLAATRLPSIVCLFTFILANCWYALLPLHQSGAKWFILVARFIVGLSSGSITACRTFLTQGTLVSERTTAIAHLSLAQAVGFVMGPVGQLVLKPLGTDGVMIGSLPVNMYTAVGWLTATLGLVNVVFFHPRIFHESEIAVKEAERMTKRDKTTILDKNGNPDEKGSALNKEKPRKGAKEGTRTGLKPDYGAISAIVVTFFIIFFQFVMLETLGTPVSMEQFGWSATKALTVVGWTMIVSSIVSTAIFFLIPILAKYFDERVLLVGFGMIPMTVGRIFFFPYSSDVAPMERYGCLAKNGEELIDVDELSCKLNATTAAWDRVEYGCPEKQTWCFTIRALSPIMVAVGYAFCTLGFPFCIAMSQTIFSKMLGPKPQGIWMGGLTSVSSLARVIGPIFVTYIYTEYGTILTSGISIALMVATVLLLLLMYRRLTPLSIKS